MTRSRSCESSPGRPLPPCPHRPVRSARGAMAREGSTEASRPPRSSPSGVELDPLAQVEGVDLPSPLTLQRSPAAETGI